MSSVQGAATGEAHFSADGQEKNACGANHTGMNRKQRTILFLVVFWSALLGVSGVWFWRMDRQERLNRELIAAIKREDYPSAIAALQQGADANARDEPVVPIWQRLWDLARGQKTRRSNASTALLLLLGWNKHPLRPPNPFKKECLELTSALLAHGAQVNLTDQSGCSALYYALYDRKVHDAQLLIEHGANVSNVINGYNLLTLEIQLCPDTGLAQLMLQHGAEVNTSGNNYLPLQSAIFANNPAMVRLLVRYKVDVNIQITEKNALGYAEKYHLNEIAKILRDAGTKP